MTIRKFFFLYILLFFSLQYSFCIDLITNFNISNMGFESNQESSEMAVVWGTSVYVEQKIDETYLFRGGLIVDDVTGNRLDSIVVFRTKYFQLGLGPSIASFNNSQLQLKPGINGYFQFKKDGSFYVTSKIYSTIGNLSDQSSDYSQLETSIALGLYVPGAICTFSIENKQFTWLDTDSSSLVSKTSDYYSIYKMEADVHKKNIPFHLILTLGYKDIQRIFPANDSSGRSTAGIGSAFIGVGTIINFNRNIVFGTMIDSGFYNFSLSDEIDSAEMPEYLFNISSSFTYRF